MIHDLEFSQVELQVNFTFNNGQEFDPFTNNMFQGTVTIPIYFNSLYMQRRMQGYAAQIQIQGGKILVL